jgi:hypothetical protein
MHLIHGSFPPPNEVLSDGTLTMTIDRLSSNEAVSALIESARSVCRDGNLTFVAVEELKWDYQKRTFQCIIKVT